MSGGSVYFSTTKKGEVHELKNDLNCLNKEKIKEAVKKVIAAMTVGKDVSALFADVIKSMQTDDLELKKLIYLYIINYARAQPEKAILVVNTFQKDAKSDSPLIRALAVRTMGCIRVDRITDYLCDPLALALKDSDPYVKKTAAVCVAKLYDINAELVEDQGLIDVLRTLISDSNAMVVANAVASLAEIAATSGKDILQLNSGMLAKLMAALHECTEWGQVFIMDTLADYHPDEREAKDIIERVSPSLKHANCAVSLAAVRVIMAYLPAVKDAEFRTMCSTTKLPPPLITLTVHHSPEVQYVALRNINLIVQAKPGILSNDIKHFFVKYNDPLYVKTEKLEIMIKLCNSRNIDKVLMELANYASEIDVNFVRKSVKAIGRVAIKIEKAAERCIKTLLNLIDSKDSEQKSEYVLQEAICVIKDIFRKYPNRYESIISVLCDKMDNLTEPEAMASMVWIVGEYADRIDSAPELLEQYVESFIQEDSQVQLQLLTAVVKLFLKRPEDAKQMVTKVLELATKTRDNPDLRDRGYVYWRLLSTDPAAAQAVVLASRPPITDSEYHLDPPLLATLISNLSTLASVYHKPPEIFLKDHKSRVVFKNRGQNISDSDASDSEDSSSSSSSDSDSEDSDDEAPAKVAAPAKVQAPAQPAPAPVIDIFGDMGDTMAPSPAAPAGFVLRDGAADGLKISSTYKRSNGAPTLCLVFTNNGAGTLSRVMLRLDDNVLGVQPARQVPLASPIGPGQTGTLEVALVASKQPVDKNNRGLWVAVKQDMVSSNNGVLYLTDTSLPKHFQVMFDEKGACSKNQFIKTWRGFTAQNERSAAVGGLRYSTVADIKTRLTSSGVAFIAHSPTKQRGDKIFFSLGFRGVAVLVEFTLKNGAGSVCVRCAQPLLAELSLAGVQNLLTT